MPPSDSASTTGSTTADPVVVFVDGNRNRGQRVQERLSPEVPVSHYPTPEAAIEELGGSLAVLVVSAAFPAEAIETLVSEATRRSPFCHVGLLSKDRADLQGIEVRRDEELTSPLTWGEFAETIESMFLRARYLAGLQRFYKQSLALNTRRIELRGEDPGEDEAFRTITNELSRLEGRLDALSARFSPEEYRAVMQRMSAGDERDLGEGKPITNPGVYGLPDECPSCALPFGHWHGASLGHGFERIAANVWRCTECDRVFDNPDPSDRRIARR